MAIALGNFQGISIVYATEVAASSGQLTYGNRYPVVDEGQTVGPDADVLDCLAQERNIRNQRFAQPQISLFSKDGVFKQKQTMIAKEPEGGKTLAEGKDFIDKSTMERLRKIEDDPSLATREDVTMIIQLFKKLDVLDEELIDGKYRDIQEQLIASLDTVAVRHPDPEMRKFAEAARFDYLKQSRKQDLKIQSMVADSVKFKDLWGCLDEAVQAKDNLTMSRIVRLLYTKFLLEKAKMGREWVSEVAETADSLLSHYFKALDYPHPTVRRFYLELSLGRESKEEQILVSWRYQERYIEQDLENADPDIRIAALREVYFFAKLDVKEAKDKLEYLSKYSQDPKIKMHAEALKAIA